MLRLTTLVPLLCLALFGVQAKKMCGVKTRGQCVLHHLCDIGFEDGASVVDLRTVTNSNQGCASTQSCCPLDKILQERNDENWMSPPDDNSCGQVNKKGLTFSMRSADGMAQEHELPWMTALLHRNNTYLGGGSLIASDVVLTASHVTSNFRNRDIIVRAGEWDMITQTEQLPHVNVRVRMIVRHPDFNRRTGENNIALLFLEKPLETSRHIRPICLPSRNQRFDRKRCIVSGWGKDAVEQGSNMNILKMVDLPVVSSQTCETLMKRHKGRNFQLHDSMMCAGGKEGKDACNGDGGSPLACPLESDPDRFEQAGIVNWGVNCGMADTPGVYTDVAKFRSWIDQQIEDSSQAKPDSTEVEWNSTTQPNRPPRTTRRTTVNPNEINASDLFNVDATVVYGEPESVNMVITKSK